MARLAAAASALALLSTGCPGPPCPAYRSGADLTRPATSLSSDVVPIFHASCSLPSCHSTAVASGGMVLDQSASTAVHAAIVGKASSEVPAMLRVTAADPSQSYLMHKMDGDSCGLAGCDGGLCAVSMPSGADLLPAATRDVVRRWIAQGAPDN